MRILLISRWFPYPPDNGSRIRIYNLLKQLSKRNEITLLSFCEKPVSEERLGAARSVCRSVHTVPYRTYQPARLRALLGFFSWRPRSVTDTYSREMAALVKEASVLEDFDAVVATEIDCGAYALLVERSARVWEDLELAAIYDQFAKQRSWARKARLGLTWWKQSRFVARQMREFDGCTVVSERERKLVVDIVSGKANVTVVPNGVDLEANAGDFGEPVPDTLIYPGALTYSANFDAMDFFLRDVFPLIRENRPGVKLRITGQYNGVPVEKLPLGAGVELTGYLPDIRPVIAQSWACVVPLRTGGGTRLKILESMALSTPVVSTSKGAEGLSVTHEENILIADTPEQLAKAILGLLGDPVLRQKLQQNGQELVRSIYDWKGIGEKLHRFLTVVSQPR